MKKVARYALSAVIVLSALIGGSGFASAQEAVTDELIEDDLEGLIFDDLILILEEPEPDVGSLSPQDIADILAGIRGNDDGESNSTNGEDGAGADDTGSAGQRQPDGTAGTRSGSRSGEGGSLTPVGDGEIGNTLELLELL